jgi:hypothetical protein
MHQCLDKQEALSLDDTSGDHATMREDKCASRRAYCFAVIRGRDLFSPLEGNDALTFPVLPCPFTATDSCPGFAVWNHKYSRVKKLTNSNFSHVQYATKYLQLAR